MEIKSANTQVTNEAAVELCRQYLESIVPEAIDPETPARMAKALREMTTGYSKSPLEILSKQFPTTSDGIVILKGIRFTSVCEHHILPFVGTAAVGYIPTGKIVGLSKLARVTEAFAQRLQVQERLTDQIAEAVQQSLDAKAVGVVMQAQHQCMACRGVRQSDAQMITSSLRGTFKTDATARAEFLGMVR